MPKVNLNTPTKGTKGWHTLLNANFDDIEYSLNAHHRLAGLFFAHEQDPADMSVQVDAGIVWDRKTITDVAAQNTANFAAPTSDDRIDRIVLDDNDGTISVETGTEAASPSPPAIPDGKLPCAQVYLTPTTSSITNSDITDERVILPDSQAAALRGVKVDSNDDVILPQSLIYGYGQKIDFRTADFTLAAADMGKTLDCEKSTTLTITVPSNANVALPVGYSITIVRAGDGTVEMSPQSGVSVRTKETLSISRKWGAVTLYKRATDEWVAIGDIW